MGTPGRGAELTPYRPSWTNKEVPIASILRWPWIQSVQIKSKKCTERINAGQKLQMEQLKIQKSKLKTQHERAKKVYFTGAIDIEKGWEHNKFFSH